MQSHGLKQSLKQRHITMIALGGVIGAGLFMGSGSLIASAGPAAILSYFIGGLVVTLVMFMLGEMACTTRMHSTHAQAQRLIEALRKGPVSTIEAAQDLDIVHPPSTIRHLRQQGWGILTRWCYQAAAPGRPPNRVGLYVLGSVRKVMS